MATRFGGSSPTHAYQARMRWLVSALVGSILVLIGTVFFLVQNKEQPTTTEVVSNKDNAVPMPVSANTVEVLFAKQRIEEGSQLEPFMFESQPLPADRLPEGVFHASEISTLTGKFSKTLINANLPIIRDYITETQPITSLNIPPGFRAVTITVDARSGVEGFARPNTRVDVLWTYTDRNGARKVATIVRFVKILSVAGMTSHDGRAPVGGNQTTVTILVSERDAKKVELARNLGTLSLTLVGQEEPEKLTPETPDPVDINSILGGPAQVEIAKEEPSDGVMYTNDPKTGRQVRYLLRGGRWQRDTSED